MKKLALWTIIALLALVFYYSFNLNALRKIAIFGDENFEKSVIKGLRMAGVNFVLSDGKVDAIFDQRRKICEVHKSVYNLRWKYEKIVKVKEELGYDVKIYPMVDGKISRDWALIYRECGKIVKGRQSTVFENGWLVAEMAIERNGKLIGTYDPKTDTLEVYEK